MSGKYNRFLAYSQEKRSRRRCVRRRQWSMSSIDIAFLGSDRGIQTPPSRGHIRTVETRLCHPDWWSEGKCRRAVEDSLHARHSVLPVCR